MKLVEATWKEVADFSREAVILVPTGSIEQHGPHLPLITDTLLATTVAEAVESRLANETILVPTIWLGGSRHHMKFSGSLSATTESYVETLAAVLGSMHEHGFWKFFVVNGHGGNTDMNSLACREFKDRHKNIMVGHAGYFDFIPQTLLDDVMEGPIKGIRHACEAETSLVEHVAPQLVRRDLRRADGLANDCRGIVWHFDECTEEGSFGDATLSSASKGKVLFDAAVDGVARQVKAMADGVSLSGLF